jgi:uncharacterized membrane protein YcaP (DUF421 family)
MFFDGWMELVRVLVFGVAAYVALVFFLRLSGKRTLSKMDTFDFVITTALGSALAQVVISKNGALATGLAAFAVIIGLQFVATWLSKHYRFFRGLIKDEPTLIYFRGEFMEAAMRREHVSADEILAAVRSSGYASLEDVEAVVLEADSSFSVIRRAEDGKTNSSLLNVSQVRPDSDEPVSTA